MPTVNDNDPTCWECGEILPDDGNCKCGHEADLIERIGFDRQRCPHCKANTRNGLCLNGCTLPGWQYRLLTQMSVPPIGGTKESS